MIRVSAGTAHLLGFRNLNTDVMPKTAYLMTGERCIYNCGFCPQSKDASSRSDLLSRITWQDADINNLAKKIAVVFNEGRIKRVCLQVVTGRATMSVVRRITSTIKSLSEVPICISARFKNIGELKYLADSGADRITIALDAASPRVFREVKGGSWGKTMSMLTAASNLLPGRISTHLIVGLGETEEEMVNILQHMRNLGVRVGLFAFTPVPGTKMAYKNSPELDSYRRVQAAHYLIDRGFINANGCKFDSGRLKSFGVTCSDLRKYLSNGKAFETSGCPDCNRPYYNEKPGGVLYNYPRKLAPNEIEDAINTVLQTLEGVR